MDEEDRATRAEVEDNAGVEEIADGVDLGGFTTYNTAEKWKNTLTKVVNAVVVLKVTQTRAFDTESAGSSYATGFVVDKKLGIILTNRHVITPGPVVAEAVFSSREEVTVRPLYFDPVHDFGFFRFDPSKIKFMTIEEVPLVPEAAVVGLDIRVVGNDSGEKISILSGTLARLDRDAPHYSRKGYNDFNVFYLQAASGTKGGSSGSPVIDVYGRCVGLNAGGKNKAASAYYLPLERVVRALRILQTQYFVENKPTIPCNPNAFISRGDLQATFVFKGFDEVKRLGLRPETEAIVREAHGGSSVISNSALEGNSSMFGMLVVDSVVPGDPCSGNVLAPGDVLVTLNGVYVSDFLTMETILDDHVGSTVTVTVERGGVPITDAVLSVQDLHAVTPSSFIEIGAGTVHELSYQQARNNRSHTGQVYVAGPGYLFGKAGCDRHAIITAIADQPTPTMKEFTQQLLTLSQGQKVPVEYFTFDERNQRKQTILHVDWSWYGPPVLWKRHDDEGVWEPTTLWPKSMLEGESLKKKPRLASSIGATISMSPQQKESTNNTKAHVGGGPDGEAWRSFLESRLRSSLVSVDVEIPLVGLIDGVHSRSFNGCGMIVHLSENLGLVVVDRNTVAIGLGDVTLSFGAYPAELPARIRFLHPLHNFSIISFDPGELPPEARAVLSCVELAPEPPLVRGEAVELVCLSQNMRLLHRTSRVTNPAMAVSINPSDVPRFKAVGEEVIKLDQQFSVVDSGVLADQSGAVRALWGSYSEQVDKQEREWIAGLPTLVFLPWVQAVERQILESKNAIVPLLHVPVLNAELQPLLLSKAAQYGLGSEWISKLMALDPERRQVLRVKSTVANSHARQVLQDGDMVLTVDNKPVSCFSHVENIINSKFSDFEGQANVSVDLTVFRNGRVVDKISVEIETEDGLGTDRLVLWCGAQLQKAHRAVREQGFLPNKNNAGVYISRWHHGSPSHRYGLYALHWITEVNGKPVDDLDGFLKIVDGLGDGADVRVKIVHFETQREKVLTLKTDLRYWPTCELRLDACRGEWKRVQG